jgi:hypothetical protein
MFWSKANSRGWRRADLSGSCPAWQLPCLAVALPGSQRFSGHKFIKQINSLDHLSPTLATLNLQHRRGCKSYVVKR